jgi:hypothetical protein
MVTDLHVRGSGYDLALWFVDSNYEKGERGATSLTTCLARPVRVGDGTAG